MNSIIFEVRNLKNQSIMKFSFLSLTFLFSLFFSTVSWSQDCGEMDYLAKGNSWVLTQYNKGGKVTGHTDYTILDERTVDGNKEWDIKTVIKDKKDEELSSVTATAICDGEKILLDFSQIMQSSAAMESMEGMETEIEGDDIGYPFDMEEGMELEDVSVSIKASSGGVQLVKVDTKITDRMVEAKETITTPAGEFETFKITQTSEVKMGFISSETSSIDWYAPGFGIVKSEYYNKRGKLTGSSEVTKFTKG